jgi:hypothetical protein
MQAKQRVRLCEAERLAVWLSTGRLRSNSLAAHLADTEHRTQPTENRENVG